MEYKQLSDAFDLFTRASEDLQKHYGELQKRVDYLTGELENKKKELEAALTDAERSKNYLYSVLQSLNEAITVVDGNDRIVMVNRAFEDMFGKVSNDLCGKDIRQCNMHIERVDEELYLQKGKESIPILFTSSEVENGNGKKIGKVIQINDISSLKETENQRLRNRRLIAMGEMAAKIVHEVRNPLGGIELYATMLYKDLESTDKSSLAQGISSGIRNLNNLLTNMLYFSREQKPKKERKELSGVVNEAVNLVKPVIDSRGLHLHIDLIECHVTVDGELIKQVVLNLLMNAIQSIEETGSISVDSSIEGDYVLINVKDTGRGIEEKDREKIFDPFFSTKPGGTGLGLAISMKIMQAHGGYLSVQNCCGDGTQFTIKIPSLLDMSKADNRNVCVSFESLAERCQL